MIRTLLRALLPAVLVVVPLVLVTAPIAIIYSGAYDVAATRQHTPFVYGLLITSLRQSIKAHAAREVPPPPDLTRPELIEPGLVLYDRHCAVCHGAPGAAPGPLGLGLTPPPANLVIPGREWTPQELYWTSAKGLKMTGMPAWEFRLSERELWSVVAFVRTMPSLAPADYRARRARLVPAHSPDEAVP